MIWDDYAKILEKQKIKAVFGMVGDGVGLLESVSVHTNIPLYVAHDQRIAMSMAAGYAKAANQLVCYAASPGPALANLSMALLEASSQCLPIVVISNGTARHKKGSYAFQEFASMDFMKTLTKWTYRIECKTKLAWGLHYALYQAQNGKPGPVYIEIPDDLIEETCDTETYFPIKRLCFQPSAEELKVLAKTLSQSKRLVLIAGGGSVASDAHVEILSLVNSQHAAIFCTAAGRGIISEDHPNFVGLAGLYLTSPAEEILKKADVVFFIGSQCEETALMGMIDLIKDKMIIQLNIAPEDIGRGLSCQLGLVGDIKATLLALSPLLDSRPKIMEEEWLEKIKQVKTHQYNHLKNNLNFTQSPVRQLFGNLNLAFGKSLHLILENGLHDMWGYFYPVYESLGGSNYSPGEHTGLGLALGNTIGVKLAHPHASVVTVVGDGAFNFGQSSLALIQQFKMGVTIIIINNGGFSWPRLMQDKANIAIGCDFQIYTLERIAVDNGLFYACITSEDSLLSILQEAAQKNKKNISALIEIRVEFSQDIPSGVIHHFGLGMSAS
jgi:acetolactate synthase-1/2/3 large subunit